MISVDEAKAVGSPQSLSEIESNEEFNELTV